MTDQEQANERKIKPSQGQESGPTEIRRKRRPVLLALDLLIVLLAIAGLVLIVQPMINHWHQDQVSQELIDNFEQGDGTVTFDPDQLVVDGEDIEYFNDFDEYESVTTQTTTPATQPSGTADPADPTDPAEPTPEPTPEPTKTPEKVVVKAIGRIEIPKIKVNMPIAEGANKYNLRVAIGHHTPTAPLGQAGRTVLFGHRMYSYGRHFNRLGEVDIGDTIIVEDKQYRYTYTVDQIDRVLPKDMLQEIYAPVDGSRIMLVTCDPVRVASHRLLVRGELTRTEPKP